MDRKNPKLTLHRETLRSLQETDLQDAVGGAGTTTYVDTAIATVCGWDPPPWVSTSPPTHLCN